MKAKESKDLKSKETKDLSKILSEKRKNLRKTLLDIKSGSEKNLKKGMHLKKEIAKILTLIKEKEILESLKKEDKKEETK